MERAVVLSLGPQVALHDLPPRIGAAEPQPSATGVSYHAAIDTYQRELLLRELAQGNHAAAAKALGLQRTYLQRLLKALRID